MKHDSQKLIIFTPGGANARSDTAPAPPAPLISRRKLTPGERLLRDSAIACALLLGILSLKNIDHPAAQNAANAVTKAITLDFDVDETLGELQFVRRFLPESTLVFWNLSGGDMLKKPVEGDIVHEYSQLQPWYLFSAAEGTPVTAAKSGIVEHIDRTDAGDYELIVAHPDGTSSLYAYVKECRVEQGAEIVAGDVLAAVGMENALYFEYQRDGIPIAAEDFTQ